MKDPTYNAAEIAERRDWAVAFLLSEIDNDNAPIGWSRYLTLANWLLRTLDKEAIDQLLGIKDE